MRFSQVSIPSVEAQKDALADALLTWAKNFDFVRPKPPTATDEVPAPVNISMTTCQIQTGWSPRSVRSCVR
jgi:hypothetical protein